MVGVGLESCKIVILGAFPIHCLDAFAVGCIA